VHSPSTASVIAIVVAVTVPLEPVLPWAVAQRPTVAAAEVADFTAVTVVPEVSVTVLRVVLEPELDPAPKSRAAMTIVEPDTDTTVPEAKEAVLALPPGAAPEGRLPPAKPDGSAPPVGAPDGRVPPPGAAPPEGRLPSPAFPPKPPEQEPLTDWVIETVVAVNEFDDEPDDEPEDATAVTQSPALIVPARTLTCWVNVVLAVHVTATWPSCWFCTCIVLPETAAMVPEAAGPPVRPEPEPEPEPPPAVADDLALGSDAAEPEPAPPPHAASVATAARPAAASATGTAARRVRLAGVAACRGRWMSMRSLSG
jgi:hypothetical protein